MKAFPNGKTTAKKPIFLLDLLYYPYLWHCSEGTTEKNLKTGKNLNDN
jgi:hypothetical protein